MHRTKARWDLRVNLTRRAAALLSIALFAIPAIASAACPATATSDFDGNCQSDVLLQNTGSTQVNIWLMNGAAISSTGSPGTPGPGWSVVGVGDFNGDGFADVLWQNTVTSNLLIWLMNGTTIASSSSPGAPPSADWTVQGVGDFNGDGKADILWQSASTGNVMIWFMNGTSIASTLNLPSAPGWTVVGIGDFNGDGTADILWENEATRNNVIWFMSGTGISSSGSVLNTGPGWSVVGVGDFNGDGYADILWQNNATGQLAVWLMNGTSISSSGYPGTLGSPWNVQQVGDFNGDGMADILFYNSATSQVLIWLMNGTSMSSSGSPNTPGLGWQVQTPPPYGVPAPAKGVGFGTRTFDSTMLGTTSGTLQEFNFFGLALPSSWFTQNTDGSLLLTGNQTPGRGYGAIVAPAAYNASNTYKYQGLAFGGGMYYQVTFSLAGTQNGDAMGVQMYDALSLSGYTPLNVTGNMSIEIDGPEFNRPGSTTQYGISCHNYYYPSGGPRTRVDPSVLTSGGSPITIPSGSLSGSNTYGMLWVPATSTTQGYIQWYFNGVQVGPKVSWNQYNPSQAFPPSNAASTVCNYLDQLRMVPVVGTSNPSAPMTITSVQVWQASAANNAQPCTPKATETADFNGLCTSDIVWQNPSTGELDMWFMNGATISSSATVAASPTAPSVLQGVGDFNDDGKADMLWRNTTTGEIDLWLMNGSLVSSITPLTVSPSSDWTIQAIADFNHDGFADILWRDNVTGELDIWYMNGAAISNSVVLPYGPSADWNIVGVGDFNDDTIPDILWQQSSTGSLAMWFMSATGAVSSSATLAVSPDPGWSVQGIGDFNGDGYADILWRHACDGGELNASQCTESDNVQDTSFGSATIWLMQGATIMGSSTVAEPAGDANVNFVNWYGQCCSGQADGWSIQSVGDFNSDGTSDILWRQSGSGTAAMWLMNGTATSTSIGTSSYLYSPPTSFVIPELAPYGCPTTVLCNMLTAINNIRANGSFGPASPAPQNPAPSTTALGPLLPLTWDVSAARAAQGWANQCVSGPPNNGNFNYGQSITPQAPPGTGTDGVQTWGNEAANFTYASPYTTCSDPTTNCVDYTQIVARQSTAVGCAVSQCPAVSGVSGGPYANEVCNFSPAGNYYGGPSSNQSLPPY